MFGPSDSSDSEAGADPLVLVSVAIFNGVCDGIYNIIKIATFWPLVIADVSFNSEIQKYYF